MRTLFIFAILVGVFWWYAPQSTRDQVIDVGKARSARTVAFAMRYREPFTNWLKKTADIAYDKALALVRAQLHRAVDENVQ